MYLFRPSQPVSWTLTHLKGPDAQDYLQRLTTIPVRQLNPGQGGDACILSAQGKIQAYFSLWCLAPQEYAIEFDAGADGAWESRLAEVLEHYHFSEKFEYLKLAGLVSAWLLADASELRAGTEFISELATLIDDGTTSQDKTVFQPRSTRVIAGSSGMRAFYHGDLQYGLHWISLWGKPAELELFVNALPNLNSIDYAALETRRIARLRPRLDFEITDATIPLEVGLTEAVPGNKGCYPGQEVIERISSMGSPPKRLSKIEVTGAAIERGDVLLLSDVDHADSEIGQVTSAAVLDGKQIALAFLRKSAAESGKNLKIKNKPQARVQVLEVVSYV